MPLQLPMPIRSMQKAPSVYAVVGVLLCTMSVLPGAAVAQQDEFLPIVAVAPIYPDDALTIGLEGYVIVEFTVTSTGSVADAHVVESTSSLFDAAALDAARKFKYRPRIVNGAAIAVPGVRNKITFVLDDDGIADNASRTEERVVASGGVGTGQVPKSRAGKPIRRF
jgi:TonB family protein